MLIDKLKQLFGIGSKVNYKELVNGGALILDVRTKAEYNSGHIRGSVNIPLNNLSNHYSSLKKNKQIITCCASGVRSAQAKSILQANGFPEVYNGGGWKSLQNKIS